MIKILVPIAKICYPIFIQLYGYLKSTHNFIISLPFCILNTLICIHITNISYSAIIGCISSIDVRRLEFKEVSTIYLDPFLNNFSLNLIYI